MKLIPLASALAVSTVLSTAMATPLETLDQRLSYIMGANIAAQFKRDDIKMDFDAMKLAFDEVMNDKEQSLSDDEKRKTIAEIRKLSAEKQAKKAAELSAKNIKAGKEYLEANAKKEGVVVTKTGLQYKEITAGTGEIPKATDKVKVHYKGTLIDGTEFDSSYKRGQPATFPVTGVIKGWIEALQLMNVGDKFQLAIPSELAYGKRGSGAKIGPDTTLLFDVELLEIVK
ncbi:FKBP-type peptidyl-prolyl cis-trans isomerase [Leucothrix pacifica]|nr:FKBP-type peptidyl-prolyl cis-trans isomerase [Leucothrix pacifica]